MNAIHVELIGFGQIGRMLFRKWADGRLISVEKVVDPAFAGEDARKLAGLSGGPLEIAAEPVAGPELAVVTTTSRVDGVLPLIKRCVELEMSVVTSCEELFFDRSEAVREVADFAEKQSLAILACGINPGFLMDLLPTVLSGASMNIRSITVERYQDASDRRTQFQKKIGAGLSLDAFAEAVNAGTLRHVGLTESMRFLADALGWELAEITEEISPVTDNGAAARGVRQLGIGKLADGREAVRLDFQAAVGEPEPRDRIVIEGEPRIESVIPGGLNGDAGTCAVITSLVRRVASCGQTGLLTLKDLPIFPGNGL